MKLADLPKEVLEDLSQEDSWRLDIDRGLDCKHEFYLTWKDFVLNEPYSYYQYTEDDLAEFLNFNGYDVLLPVPREHYNDIRLIRLIPGVDGQVLTIFLHDSFHKEYFQNEWGARYGYLAIAERYQKFGCDFYLASYYHFSYLLNQDYEAGKKIMAEKLNQVPS